MTPTRIMLDPDGYGQYQAVMPDGRRLFSGKDRKGNAIETPKSGAIRGAVEILLAEGAGDTAVVFRHKGSEIDATNCFTVEALHRLLTEPRPKKAEGMAA